jgi:predicted aspartyl protease
LTATGNHLFTPAFLNDTETNMMFDTGSERTVITKATAERMSLSLIPLEGELSGVGGSRGVYAFYASSFRIGALHGKHLSLMVSEMDLTKGGKPVDGLLGTDFLAAYDLDLDFGEHKAMLFKAIGDCGSPSVALDEPLYSAPLFRDGDPDQSSPLVKVRIGDTQLTAVIDSGSDDTVIFRNAARRLGLKLADLAADPHFHAHGIGRRNPESVVHVMAPITIGEITVSNLPVEIIDQRSFDNADMLLGLDFLFRVHAWLSFSSHTLVMQYPPKVSPKLGD